MTPQLPPDLPGPSCATTARGRPIERVEVPPPAGDETWGTLYEAIELDDDPVNHPAHYTSSPAACPDCGRPIECIDVVRHLPYDRGAALKYVWRCGLKGDAIEDLRKARWYLADEIRRLGGEP